MLSERFTCMISRLPSGKSETEPEAEAVLFVVEGGLSLTIEGEAHEMGGVAGGEGDVCDHVGGLGSRGP